MKKRPSPMARFGNKNRLGKTKPEAERLAQVPLNAYVPRAVKARWMAEAKHRGISLARLLREMAPPPRQGSDDTQACE
jgi:hypothetical protein